jgi:hypothetical protein
MVGIEEDCFNEKRAVEKFSEDYNAVYYALITYPADAYLIIAKLSNNDSRCKFRR